MLVSYSPEIFDCQLPQRTKPAPISSSVTASSEKPSVSHLLVKAPVSKNPPNQIFDFRTDDFADAVVTPTYRNLDQPPHYYVAKIRSVCFSFRFEKKILRAYSSVVGHTISLFISQVFERIINLTLSYLLAGVILIIAVNQLSRKSNNKI